jgi:hypothetical protein
MTGGCRLNRDTYFLVQQAGFDGVQRVQRLQGMSELIIARRPTG